MTEHRRDAVIRLAALCKQHDWTVGYSLEYIAGFTEKWDVTCIVRGTGVNMECKARSELEKYAKWNAAATMYDKLTERLAMAGEENDAREPIIAKKGTGKATMIQSEWLYSRDSPIAQLETMCKKKGWTVTYTPNRRSPGVWMSTCAADHPTRASLWFSGEGDSEFTANCDAARKMYERIRETSPSLFSGFPTSDEIKQEVIKQAPPRVDYMARLREVIAAQIAKGQNFADWMDAAETEDITLIISEVEALRAAGYTIEVDDKMSCVVSWE